MTSVAVVATGLAITFAVMGASAKGEYDRATFSYGDGRGSTLSRLEAQDLAARANGNFSVALVSGLGAAMTGGIAGYLWATR
jgi:hypothetical protein